MFTEKKNCGSAVIGVMGALAPLCQHHGFALPSSCAIYAFYTPHQLLQRLQTFLNYNETKQKITTNISYFWFLASLYYY